MKSAPIAARPSMTRMKAAPVARPRRRMPRRWSHSTSGLMASARKTEMAIHTSTLRAIDATWSTAQTAIASAKIARIVRTRKRMTRSATAREHRPRVGRSRDGGGLRAARLPPPMSRGNFETSMGAIEFELFDEDAPETVANFKKLAGDGFYEGVIFHRVIPDFMIQG